MKNTNIKIGDSCYKMGFDDKCLTLECGKNRIYLSKKACSQIEKFYNIFFILNYWKAVGRKPTMKEMSKYYKSYNSVSRSLRYIKEMNINKQNEYK